ncbi:sensor histidine kinase [Paenibacillus eucommiae]|uniref:histidine kinase n=1 Tax=Paenibacillus eucommiae TaxID=1355755 RepID=A0ABS4JB47_9BACL|nr:sensor histidine kinase [Paenibacillus eucommiae]MBP1997062.1 OmpR family two-component system bacitracin resistance sensor histidine kinase BceS [Paenibacillus eucommiae]
MILRYLYDRKSWILFFVLSLLFVDLMIWIDNGIAIRADSMLFLNMLLILAMAAFLGWRYQKEMKYARSLMELAEEIHEDWIETLPAAYFYQEEATNQLLRAADHWYWHKVSDGNAARSVEQDYIASWVHEVKTPLTAMKLTIDANKGNPALRKIESEWLRIHLLIDQQLYISRLPSLEADYVLEQTGIQQLAAQEVRELASWCVEKNIAVEFDGEEGFVRTDRKWCRFIIRQLLTNAVKYSPEGGIIYLSTTVTPDGHVRMMIKDEGPGIATHDLPRIFDKGFTGGNGRLQNAATGLGLYLARTVAVKIGISLTVQSGVHEGTAMEMTFTVSNAFESVRT